jgi:hypothetical protein
MLPFILLNGVTTLRLDEVGALQQDPSGTGRTQREALPIRPDEEPDYEDDWLLDIRLYSHGLGGSSQHPAAGAGAGKSAPERTLRARSSLTPGACSEVQESGLPGRRFDRPGSQDDRRGCQSRPAELFNVVQTIYSGWADAGAKSASTIRPPCGARSKSSTSAAPSGKMVEATFGYEEGPMLRNFLVRLMVTDYAHHLRRDAAVDPWAALPHRLVKWRRLFGAMAG